MERPQDGMTFEAELHVPLATVALARYDYTEPCDSTIFYEEAHCLDLSLTPRPPNSRACYIEYWGPHRFERLGEVIFLPAGEAFHLRRDRGGNASITCQLHTEAIRALFEDDLAWTDRLEASLDISSSSIRSLTLRLGEEVRHPGFASQMLAELITAQIAIELFRYRAAISDGPATGGLAPWRLRIIDERLAEHCAAPTLVELGRLCHLSVRQLTRGFRASRGCSIGDYVTRSQIDHAKRLLSTDESIKSIAYSLGFASPTNFSYAFRRATGLTPREFRQRELRTRQ
jgi:AraC family transcriptional regulator